MVAVPAELDAVVAAERAAKPDVLLVAFGNPKQAKMILERKPDAMLMYGDVAVQDRQGLKIACLEEIA